MDPASPERFRQADAVFDAALDLPTHERDAYIDRACAGDPHLHAALQRLLRAHQQADEFLAAPAANLAAPLLAASTSAPPPTLPRHPERVGPFRIVREIGHGGMGAVYLAERNDEQFRQRVALKLVRGDIGSDYLRRRFLEERQILASLEHPHIARLLDGGVTADGLSYFAMEYVEGEPVTDYCEGCRLSIEERLDLFLDVRDAVGYAHRNLIVHRDVKPSNILVNRSGRAKLLDFGIAKLLGEETEAGLTGTGMRLLTREYASPEQIRGEAITTGSDAYALGILLYELLTGCHPFPSPGMPRHEVERRTLDQEPARAASAAAHITTPRRLRRRLLGDLDTIVLKAIRKEPERRYLTAEQFAADVRRHLRPAACGIYGGDRGSIHAHPGAGGAHRAGEPELGAGRGSAYGAVQRERRRPLTRGGSHRTRAAGPWR